MSDAREPRPFHCPFCGEEDLVPARGPQGAWHCRACVRAFPSSLVKFDCSRSPPVVQSTELTEADHDAPPHAPATHS